MKAMEYQTPKLQILLLESEDVITTSDLANESKVFDKGVEDFFGN